MAGEDWISKSPAEVLNYQRDWTAELAGDTIATSDITRVSGTTVIDSQTKTDTASQAVFSGGADGEITVFRVLITTAAGLTFEDYVSLPIRSDAPVDIVVTGYAAPTPANLIDLYPAFAAVAPRTIQLWLTRAGTSVDDTWDEADYPFAILALAAHYLESNGLGTGAAAQAAAAGASEYKTMRSGALTLERFDKGSSASASGFASTRYGREYLDLLRRNRGGPLVLTGPYAQDAC